MRLLDILARGGVSFVEACPTSIKFNSTSRNGCVSQILSFYSISNSEWESEEVGKHLQEAEFHISMACRVPAFPQHHAGGGLCQSRPMQPYALWDRHPTNQVIVIQRLWDCILQKSLGISHAAATRLHQTSPARLQHVC